MKKTCRNKEKGYITVLCELKQCANCKKQDDQTKKLE